MLCLQNKSFTAMVEESEKTGLGSENDDEGEEEVKERRKKWLQQYSSHHRILLVGEGDFSFSSSLASAFGSASNVTATSLDPYDDLIRKYKNAKSNLGKLKKLGASLLHEVDATIMKLHVDLRVRKFDRIIFNFPHAGFKGKEDDVHLISMHRELMRGFFHNASQMLRADGEVHVSHKITAPFCHWNLKELAFCSSLKLIDQTAFKSKNYPGYHNKRGDSWRCDEPFPLGLCSTFKFRFYPAAMEVLRELMRHNIAIHGGNRQIYVSPVQMPVEFPLIYESSVRVDVGSERNYKNLVRTQEQSLPLSFGPFPSVTHVPLSRNTHIQLGMNSRNAYGGISVNHGNIVQEIPQRACYDDAGFRSVPLPGLTHIQLGMNSRNGYGGVSAYHGNIVQEIPQRTCYDDVGFCSVPLPGLASEQHYADVERRTSVGDLYLFHGLQHQEYLRRLIYYFGRP